jgi:hypothetical protein
MVCALETPLPRMTWQARPVKAAAAQQGRRSANTFRMVVLPVPA